MTHQRRYLLLVNAAIVLLLTYAAPASAARLSVDVTPTLVRPGDRVLATVILDTEGESLNAFEGTVLFPADIFTAKELRDGNTFVNVWLEPPSVREPGRISFSGITPGGYRGAHGLLLSVMFEALTEGEGTISLNKIQLLKNDGEGTSANLVLPIASPNIAVSKSANQTSLSEVSDTQPPEPFSIETAQDKEVFGGKQVLIFATQDKSSGIEYYEVCEGVWGGCVRAESPYVLRHQLTDRYFKVRAVDFYGNERIAVLLTSRAMLFYAFCALIGILFITGGIFFIRRVTVRPSS